MAGQLPRPWFRLGSITRPTTATTTAPVTEPARPAPTLLRPPIIRPAPPTEPAEPTTPPQSKSPPPLPRPASLTPPQKKPASPPSTTLMRPVLPSPSNGHRVGSAHSSPPQKAVSPALKPSISAPESPTNGVSSINNDSTLGAARSPPSPIQSPLLSNSIPALPSPHQSPKPNATATPPVLPPSPLVLPPSQLQSVGETKHESIPEEVERKTVVFQKNSEKPSQPDHHLASYHNHHNPTFGQNGKQEALKRDDQGKAKAMRPKNNAFASDKDTNTRVITMAGENRGAFMEVVLSDKNNSRHHQIHQNKNKETEIEESNNLNNNNSKNNIKSNKKASMGARTSLPMKAYLNSNVQGINNSILMDSSFTHHDPGIHIVFSRIPLSADQADQGQQ